MRRHKGGFTLTEIIISIAVLAVLAAILIPTLPRLVGNAQDTVCMANRREVQNMFLYNGYKTQNENQMAAFKETLDVYFKGKDPLCPCGGTYTWDESDQTVRCSKHGKEPYSFDFGSDTKQVQSTANYFKYIQDFLASSKGKEYLSGNGILYTADKYPKDTGRLAIVPLHEALKNAGLEDPVNGLTDSAIFYEKIDGVLTFAGAAVKKGDIITYYFKDGTVFIAQYGSNTNPKTLLGSGYITGYNQNSVFFKLRADIQSGNLHASPFSSTTQYTPFDFSTLPKT